MKKFSFLIAIMFSGCILNLSWSQTPGSDSHPKKMSFEATTPCSDEAKQLLGIPADLKCEMMKWSLSLYRDDKGLPSLFQLRYSYGAAKQGSRGFTDGAKTTELKGKWTIKETRIANSTRGVITLVPDNSTVRISFMQPGEGLLHLLDKNKTPMVGGAAWSYTLNTTNPTVTPTGSFVAKELVTTKVISDADTVGEYFGRTPCNEALRKLNNISAQGCNLIKCRVVLLQDPKTHTPTNFIIQTIYVGAGDDNKYTVTGKWKMMQGTPADPSAIIYQLKPDKLAPGNEILLLKADDNILFFISKNSHLLIGNDYCSYTLNRAN